MQRPSKFNENRPPTNIYHALHFTKHTLNKRYRFSKVLTTVELFNVHEGVDMLRRKSVVVVSIVVAIPA